MRSTLAILGILFALNAYADHRTRVNDTSENTYAFRSGAPLTVETANGSIHVRSDGDDGQVHVTARTHVQADSDDVAHRAMAELKPRVSHDGGGLQLVVPELRRDRDDELEGGVSFDITIPRSAELSLNATNGEIEVRDVRGAATLRTTNGHITVERAGGSVDAETTNGSIRAELLDVTPAHALRFLTTNGSVTVTVPSNIAADVDASTTNGVIRSDFPILTDRAEPRSLSGRINGGGPELRAKTTNGSITIRSAAARD
jgi:DUF4097 and DUF4098 domain-containing protein YvlB